MARIHCTRRRRLSRIGLSVFANREIPSNSFHQYGETGKKNGYAASRVTRRQYYVILWFTLVLAPEYIKWSFRWQLAAWRAMPLLPPHCARQWPMHCNRTQPHTMCRPFANNAHRDIIRKWQSCALLSYQFAASQMTGTEVRATPPFERFRRFARHSSFVRFFQSSRVQSAHRCACLLAIENSRPDILRHD